MMKNIKDIATTIAGILGAIALFGGAVATYLIQNNITIPTWAIIIIGLCGMLSPMILGYFNGKNSDGSTKTPDQLTFKKE